MEYAERIAILGFAYHHLNMRRLKITTTKKDVIGTSRGFTATENTFLGSKYNRLGLGFQSSLELLRESPLFQD
jgi:hypothetical protein